MRLLPLPLVATVLLLAGCSSFRTVPVTYKPAPPPVMVGNKITTWGELPSYETAGHHFRLSQDRRPRQPTGNGVAIVDVLVAADGRVTDAAIFESSGRDDVDQYALRLYKASRYSLRLRSGDPAPHVVRQQFFFRVNDSPLRIDATNYQSLGPNVTPSAFPGSD